MSEPLDPYTLFASMFDEASASGNPEPSAFGLSTVDSESRPSSRMLLLKGIETRGFVFYTNLNSRKAMQLENNSNAAMCFYWPQIGRQVRIEGQVERVSDTDADEYFRTRERGSQIGAWASLQSSELSRRQDLLDRVSEIETRYSGIDVPRPPYWSGFRLIPRLIEFWSAGEFRLHERLVYESDDAVAWRSRRLYP
ncbi:MAG: pyridoxamine 5'-phosphate oxidase [bacterium]|nr:pyridoxamine 5'-phosphate oxidase [Candidatus Kapabacteria bacterium]